MSDSADRRLNGTKPAMNLTLTVVKGPPGFGAVAKSFESTAIAARGATVGRQSENDLALTGDASVSRRHCRIVFENGGFALIDMSSFGSEVNGRRVANG